jgi:cytochrome c biogenesis protein ResB
MKVNLASTRFAFFLLAVLTLLVVVSAIVPQRDIAQNQIVDWRHMLGDGYVVVEKLQLDRIYTSPLFLITIALMCVNLIAGNAQRMGRLRKVRSNRGRARLLGSILFHFALIVIVAGSALNHLYKSRVVFGLTEGQQVADLPESHFRNLSGPFSEVEPGRFTIRLEEVHDSFLVGELETKAAQIAVVGAGENEPTAGVIRVNHPLKKDGLEFHLGAQIGYSPELTVTDDAGRPVFRHFVRLARQRTEDGVIDADFVFLPSDSTKIEMKMMTAVDAEAPRPLVSVEKNGEEIYAGYPGPEGAVLPDGRRVAVPRLRRWCYVEAIRNPFMDVVFAGFWIALGSLVFTLVPRMLPAGRTAS